MKKIKKSQKVLSTVLATLLVVLSLPITITAFATSSTVLPDGMYYIESALKPGMVADIACGSKDDGANCQLYEKNNTPAQWFCAIRQQNGSYIFTNAGSRKALDVAGAVAKPETNVIQFRLNSTIAQDYYLEPAGDGYWYIRSAVGENLYLDVSCAGTSNGTNIWIYTGNKTLAQKWKFIPVTNDQSAKTEPASATWQWPMNGDTTTQPFAKYSSTRKAYHLGVDLRSENKTVKAAADGVVVYKDYTSGNGKHVVISHTLNDKTVKTLYSHLDSYNSCPNVGETVKVGQPIGVMGNTGNSTGPHLHFAVYTGSTNDPWGYGSKGNSNVLTRNGCTFYDPSYVITNKILPN